MTHANLQKFIAAAIVTGLSLWLWLEFYSPAEANQQGVSTQAEEQSSAPQKQSKLSLSEGWIQPLAAQTEIKPESLISEYNNITNGRAFILKNWQLPESGGRFYAGKVADTCAGVVNFTDLLEQIQPNRVGQEDYLRASIAHKRLLQRCSQITPDELESYSRTRAATDSPPDKFSKLIKNQVEAQRSGSIDQQKSVLSQVFEAGDPLVIDEIGAFMAFRNSSTGRFYSLNGVRYSWAERDIVLASFYLAPCKLGLACDSDPLIDMQCLSGAGCFANRQERADKEMLEFDPKKILAVEVLSNKIAQAVRDKNVGFFFP